ncbi:ABC-type branched-chain amino acid transport system, substrate-binding protein [Pseudomonas linyingensis]|uniref:ABC-type branched-chain amino acid transport system, substrate-binding protein n=1 Tax=Pseudomonas linyingensis TaxID=915471 RepID=A0A1H7CH39_9PSED|nr:ABC transporter substrate-binding protein [Pseudomonas linyingensis]SEJ84995.1 ABC-type branched-chain amino acid transport system, substrate-binding protein [Pseudomonas linyingensis]
MKRTLTALALWAGLCTTASAVDPITLGLNYPRTGSYKEEGLAQMRGALLAIDELNAKGGVLGRPLRMISRDTASRPEKAVNNVNRLIDDGAAMLFGGSSSAVAIAASKRARERGILYFGTLTYSNDTTGKNGHRYMFRECNNAWMSARVLGEYLSKTLPNKRYFYITSDYTWGTTTESSLRQTTGSTDTSKHPSIKVPFPGARLADYRDALTQAASSDAEVLTLVLFGDDLVRAMRIAEDLGLTQRMQIVAPNLTQSIVEQGGPGLMQGVIGTEPWTWRVPELEKSEPGMAFVKNFSERYDLYPSSSAASAYSIVHQWADAATRARTLDSESLINALEGHKYQLLKGPQEWRALDHQNLQTVYAVKVKSRDEIMKDRSKQDYFEIVGRLEGALAAQTPEEWKQERTAAGQPPQLQ